MENPMTSKRYILLILAIMLSMSACSTKPNRNNDNEKIFTTNILSNGSKRFVVAITYAQETNQKKPPRSGKKGDGEGRGGKRPKGERSGPSDDANYTAIQRGGSDSTDDKREAVLSLLEEKLATTAYCRNGFIELEYSQMPDKTELKGECQESASAQDKKRWG
jgi:hypothetical protein